MQRVKHMSYSLDGSVTEKCEQAADWSAIGMCIQKTVFTKYAEQFVLGNNRQMCEVVLNHNLLGHKNGVIQVQGRYAY